MDKEIVLKAAELLNDKKASKIFLLDVKSLCSFTDYFLICSASNPVLLKAITDNLVDELNKLGITPLRIEGKDTNSWILIDYGDLIVNIMTNETREFYNLEGLWSDAETIELEFNNEN